MKTGVAVGKKIGLYIQGHGRKYKMLILMKKSNL
jgi:hypothetical protein